MCVLGPVNPHRPVQSSVRSPAATHCPGHDRLVAGPHLGDNMDARMSPLQATAVKPERAAAFDALRRWSLRHQLRKKSVSTWRNERPSNYRESGSEYRFLFPKIWIPAVEGRA